MKLKYWQNFSKRKNSTKIPSTLPTEIDIVLKEDTPIDSPSIILTGNTIDIDYCRIDAFGKYYFVGEPIILTDGMTQYNLQEDVLATHKTEVGNTKAMILRSSTGYNVWIPDHEVYVSAQKTIVRAVDDLSTYFADSTGCYLLSVVNEYGSYSSFAAQYYMSGSGLESLANDLLDSTIIDDILKYYSNVSNAIISLKWMPFAFASVSTGTMTTFEAINAANHTLGTQAYRITGSTIYVDGATTLAIPWRSDQDYRCAAPYTQFRLLVPMYGFVDLNASDLVGATNLYIQYRVDRTTGDVIVIINADSAGAIVQTLQFNVAVEVPVATLTRNIGGAASAISGGINSAIGIAAGNYIGGGIGLITSAAQMALSLNGRSISLKGSLDGKAATAYGDKFQIVGYAPHTLDPTNADFIATKGRPCQYVDTISNHSGFVLCDNASVEIAGDNTERDEINSFLNSGFYYE